MARPAIPPEKRFPDIAQLLDQIIAQPKPVHLYLESKDAAIALTHRFNMYRKAVRDMYGNTTVLDGFVFRHREHIVEIADKIRASPFNMKIVNAEGKDVTEEAKRMWHPISHDGSIVEANDPHYAGLYRAQFGIDPPSAKPKSAGNLQLDIEGGK